MEGILFDQRGEKREEIFLSDEVFGVEVNYPLLHEAVLSYRSNQRLGTVETKTRAQVRGGGGKPWPQKGTGRARVGSIRSPLWRGGGVIFGPHQRNYGFSLTKKKKKLAFKSALSLKQKEKRLFIIDELKFEQPKTKNMLAVFKNLKLSPPILVIIDEKDENVIKSTRNIEKVKISLLNNINVYDLLKYENLLITRKVLNNLEEWLKK